MTINQNQQYFLRSRTNSLSLRDIKRHTGENTDCPFCEGETESLEHFMLECNQYNDLRMKCNKLQKPYIEDKSEIIGNVLFGWENFEELEEVKTLINNFWKKRERRVKELTD